jgi:hypothetical protein
VKVLAGPAEGDYADVRRRAVAGVAAQVELMRGRLAEVSPRDVKYDVFVNVGFLAPPLNRPTYADVEQKLANVLLASRGKIREIVEDEDGGEEWRRLDVEIGWLLERYKDCVMGRSQAMLVEL